MANILYTARGVPLDVDMLMLKQQLGTPEVAIAPTEDFITSREQKRLRKLTEAQEQVTLEPTTKKAPKNG